MSNVLIRTARFFLRPVTTDDVTETYVGWLRDNTISRYIVAARDHQDVASVRAYVAERADREDVVFLGIFVAETGLHIGNIKFEPVDSAAGCAVMGILIGEGGWRGRGVAAEVLDASARWLRSERSISRIVLGVESTNAAAIRAYRKVGFKVTETSKADPKGVSTLTMVRDARPFPRLALGTVQFGLPYGVANRTGQVEPIAAAAIVANAWNAGLDTLDTAVAYGESERRLGQIGVREWRVTSKLPPVPDDCGDVLGWVQESVAGSLARLGIPSLHGLLLHRPADLLGPHGVALHGALVSLKEEGLVEGVGVSVSGPDELEALWGRFALDLVQAPYNVIDRRIATSGWLARLSDGGVAVHARSAFLQGLLLMPRGQLPGWSRRWDGLWDRWHGWLDHEGVSPLAACLGFALAEPRLDRVVVGVDSLQQLNEVLFAAERAAAILPDALACKDLDLIDPSRWDKH